VERIDALMKCEGDLIGAQGAAALPGVLSLPIGINVVVDPHSSLNFWMFLINDFRKVVSLMSERMHPRSLNFRRKASKLSLRHRIEAYRPSRLVFRATATHWRAASASLDSLAA
jgi:hypothetical protein